MEAVALETMLRESLWAGTLPPAELDRVVCETHEKRVPAGACVMRCGDPADHWYGVIEGLVKMSVSLPDGKQSTFTGVTAGGWAGEGSLLKPTRWRYDGVAVRDCRMACMPRHTFERLISTHLGFARFMMNHLNARLSLFIGLVEYDRLFGPDARLARCLASLFDADLYPRAGNFVALSQEEIGLLAGVSRQRANASLHVLQRAGLLRVEFGGVTVLDVAGLRCFSASATGERRRAGMPAAAAMLTAPQ